MGRKRGVDLPDKTDEAVKDIAESADASENKVIVTLVDLGLILYGKLPGSMREKIWRPPPKFTQQQRLRVKLEQRAEKLAESSKMDTFVVFRVPAEKKRLLRSRAEDAKLDVSKFIRSRILEEKED